MDKEILVSLDVNIPNLKIDILLDYKTHPYLSGNKWRKLKYALKYLEEKRIYKIQSMSGNNSNYLMALAKLVSNTNFEAEVFTASYTQDTYTLNYAKKAGVKIRHIDRTDYRLLRENPLESKLIDENAYWIGEGGSSSFAIKGCEEILKFVDLKNYNEIHTCAGTGTTAIGIGNSLTANQHLFVHHSFQETHYSDKFNQLCQKKPSEITFIKNIGKFGKVNDELVVFINRFWQNHKIPLEPIYSAKMMRTILSRNYATPTSILMVHNGGLQGIAAYNYSTQKEKIDIITN